MDPSDPSDEEVETLVKQLYKPSSGGNVQVIKQIEGRLRDLQKSPRGWAIADFLLGRDDPNVRFFGALTFQVKLNTGTSELEDEALRDVGRRLVYWLQAALARGDASIVTRKLCTVSAIYTMLDRNADAGNAVKGLFASLTQRLPEELIAIDSVNFEHTTSNVATSTIIFVLWFLTALVEEASKPPSDLASKKQGESTKRIQANLEDAVMILGHCFSTRSTLAGAQENYRVQREATISLFNWVGYAERAFPISDRAIFKPLQDLITAMLEWFKETTLDEVAEMIADSLQGCGSVFTLTHHKIINGVLQGPWGQEQLQEAMVVPQQELPAFVKLLSAYTDEALKDLIENISRPKPDNILDIMHQLLQGPGVAGAEEVISCEALEFWSRYVEWLDDARFQDSEEQKPWMNLAADHVMQVCFEVWRKVKLPAKQHAKELGVEEQKAFKQFRIDVKEFLLASFPVLRGRLTTAIAQLCSDALHRKDWTEVEASLFCLGAISISEQQDQDEILSQVFGSPLFDLLKQDPGVPARAQAAGVDLLGQNAEFFESHTQYLPSALSFLFASLNSAALALNSAKAISRLCSSCRASLTSQLPSFANAYEQFLLSPTAEAVTKEKVLGGIASIIQALPRLRDQLMSLDQLLIFIRADVSRAETDFVDGRIEDGQVAALSAMQCLASIAKGFQSPNDEPLSPEQRSTMQTFWMIGPGASLQGNLFQMLQAVLQLISSSSHDLELHGDVLESICDVFKAGFTETNPGPFVFAPNVFVDFFSTAHTNTPRLELILSTACGFLRSHSHAVSSSIDLEAARLMRELLRLTDEVSEIRDCTDSTGVVEVLERFMPRYFNVFLVQSQQDLEKLFGFPLECLKLPEPLPKRAAAQFWASVLALTPSRTRVSQDQLDQVVNYFGPAIAHALMSNIAGGSTRTDLDWLADPLKKFQNRTGHTRRYLEEAASSADVAPTVSVEEKMRFLKQLAVAQGLGTTKKAIASFWQQCRGISF